MYPEREREDVDVEKMIVNQSFDSLNFWFVKTVIKNKIICIFRWSTTEKSKLFFIVICDTLPVLCTQKEKEKVLTLKKMIVNESFDSLNFWFVKTVLKNKIICIFRWRTTEKIKLSSVSKIIDILEISQWFGTVSRFVRNSP